MSETFYTILTTVGQAKIANAQVTGQNVNLTEIAVGDGGGSYYNPVQTQTSLKNEVWRGNIGSVQVDEENPNWIVIEGVIPATVGGFFVREVGIFDDAGDMIAIGKYPETYKPVTTEGSAKDLYIRMIIEVTNASAVQLKIDPSVIIASRKYVDDKVAPVEQKANQNATSIQQLQQQVNAHLNDDVRHVTQIEKETWNNKVSKNGDVMNGSYYITSSYPIVLVNPAGGKLWTLHRSSTNVNALILAPRNNENTDWDWNKQFVFHDSLRITIGSYLDGVSIITGTNSPEGNVVANPGSIYLRNNGTVYIKASGTGNTGWKAVQTA